MQREAITRQTLSRELLVAIEILKVQDTGKKATFRGLVESLKELANRSTVSKAMDILDDQGMLDEEWYEVDGAWQKGFTIDHNSVEFVRAVARKVPE